MDISTHSLTRRLTVYLCLAVQPADISTHSLTRRLTVPLGDKFPPRFHFNSQPHKEADLRFDTKILIHIISTHSLTRRLTIRNPPESKIRQISTHSLTRRLTMLIHDIATQASFQLTASQGG